MVWLFIALILGLIALILALPTLFHGAVYMPMKHERVAELVALANVKPGLRVADFGSGDGRIVIAFARAGVQAHGYEVDPFLVLWSRWKIRKAGGADRATIHWKSFWSTNAADYDVITLYGFDTFMARLEKKLRAELRPQSRVLSHIYTFPNWESTQCIGRTFIYEQPSSPSKESSA